MKHSIFILCISIFSSFHVKAQEHAELKEYLNKIQTKVDSKWDKYRGWQENNQWLRDSIDLSLSGEIYSEGWIGPKVSRQIVPDFTHGWLVVDTITIPPNLLMTAGTLAGNIMLNQVFPYVQAGPIKQKSFVNVRKVNTYEEAILKAPFNVHQIPLNRLGFDSMEIEEQMTMTSTGGMYIRAGGGIANLIGLELPAHINIGPKSKLTFKGTLKLTVAKSKDNHALISVEKINEKSNGFGFGFGVFFEDIVDIPVTIGVNSSNGYFPFLFNVKDKYEEIKSVVYDIDINSEEGMQAYNAFLKRDFTLLDDISKSESKAVVLDMAKEGKVHTHETNGMINLIIWRSGFRNIFVEGKFNVTDRSGNRFEYFELESEEIRDRKWFSNVEKTSMKYMALVPSTRHENGKVIEASGGFVLDSHFFYDDTKTSGEEIIDISNFLMDSGTQMRLPFVVDEEKEYERVQIDLKVRVQANDIAEFLNASEEDLWISLGYAQGFNDPYRYADKSFRRRFQRGGNEREREAREQMVDRAKWVIRYMRYINEEKTLKDKAKKMIKYLRRKRTGQLLHKTMLEYVGHQKVIVRGFVRSKSL